jgi:glycosyltransferase involved in cell wall biosynthesis
MTSPMKILIIIPAYNEQDSLPRLLAEIRSCGFDAVVVDDASTDSTAVVASYFQVPVLSLAANLGIGGAVQTGFKYAVKNNYDIVVQIDGDGQHDPSWVELITSPIKNKLADCVIGSRYHPKKPDIDYKTPVARRLGMYFSTWILFFATGLRINDTTSGFRALSRPAFKFFAESYPVDHPEAETLLMLHQNGFRILEVPVKMRYRLSGQSLFTLAKATLYPLRVIIGFMGLWLARKA